MVRKIKTNKFGQVRGCTKYNWDDCKSPCEWIVGKGCKNPSPKPVRGCTKYNWDDCKSPCEWIVGKGCKNPSPPPVRRRSSKRRRSPKVRISSSGRVRGCTNYNWDDCKSPCEWIVGKGCKNPSPPPVRRRSPARPIQPSRVQYERSPVRRSLLEPEEFKEEEKYGVKIEANVEYIDVELDCLRNSMVSVRDIQRVAIEYITNVMNELLVVFGTGVGKTLTALIASICYLNMYPNSNVIVIAPKSVQNNFHKEMEKYSGGTATLDNRWKFYTFQKFHKTSRKQSLCRDNMIIIDEVHNLRNIDSKTTQSVFKCTEHAAKRMFLTATPYVNNMNDIITIVKLLKGIRAPVGHNNWEQVLRGNVVYQPKIIDENFPTKQEQYLYVDMDPQYQRVYLDAIADSYQNITNPKTFYNGYRRLVNSLLTDPYTNLKMSAIMNIINEDPTKQTLIYTSWIEYGVNVIAQVLDYYGIPYGIISGKSKQRDETIQEFNNGETRVLIITQAGSEGIDLKNVENVFVFDAVWNPAALDQIIGRAIRYKSHENLPMDRHVVNIYYVILKEYDIPEDELYEKSLSGDVILYKIVASKREEQNEIFNKLQEISID